MAPSPNARIKPTPWTYMLIRWLFKFVLKVFFSTIVIENEHFIPKNGHPTIICANHGNSLTDPLVLITSVSSKKRNYLRMTAKSTLFGKRTFSSWLIENVGSVPIKRRMDDPTGDNDNTDVMSGLMKALDEGDVVCLFPEGMSRFQSNLSPVKTGAARMASDCLTQHAGQPDFELTLLTCSITYIHPSRFRSDVLVTFNPPLRLRPSTHPFLIRETPTSPPPHEAIQSLTQLVRTQLSSGTIDAPSWETVRVSKTATRMYAPLGTRMTLGDWVRVVRTFVGGFSHEKTQADPQQDSQGRKDEVAGLIGDLNEYQRTLDHLGIKDDRIRQHITRSTAIRRLVLRLVWLSILLPLTIPGLTLWAPVFATAAYYGNKIKKTGPVANVFDEISQTKLLYGLLSGILVYTTCIAVTWPMAPVTAVIVPIWMWITLRWVEDLVSTFRALKALFRLLKMPRRTLHELQERREDLHDRVHDFALTLGLPDDPEGFFAVDDDDDGSKRLRRQWGANAFESATDGEGEDMLDQAEEWLDRRSRDRSQKGRVKSGWDAVTRYFSLVRRRKRDWNETLKWYDLTEFPEDAPEAR